MCFSTSDEVDLLCVWDLVADGPRVLFHIAQVASAIIFVQNSKAHSIFQFSKSYLV